MLSFEFLYCSVLKLRPVKHIEMLLFVYPTELRLVHLQVSQS